MPAGEQGDDSSILANDTGENGPSKVSNSHFVVFSWKFVICIFCAQVIDQDFHG